MSAHVLIILSTEKPRTSNELRKLGVFVSSSGVRSIWMRHKLACFKDRLRALEERVAQEGIILTDRGTEYCGKAEQHDYQLYLALNDIDHTRTKAKSSQTNGICERFHRTILNEFYQVTFRKKLYADIESLQQDLDEWLLYYNQERTHQGKMYCGRTPLATLEDGKQIWKEKFVG